MNDDEYENKKFLNQEEGKSTQIEAFWNISKMFFGSATLIFPSVIYSSGIIYTILVFCVLLIILVYATNILNKTDDNLSYCENIQEIIEKTLGNK